jgi:hypothetical protein
LPGGNWSPTELPVLPGFYLNFEAAALAGIQAGARGVVVLPVKANWGPPKEFKIITRESDIKAIYTNDETAGANARTTLFFALLGGAKKILAYRLVDDAKLVASITLQDTTVAPVNVLKLDTIYPTTRAFKVTVQANPIDSATKKDIKLYEGTTLLRTFTFTSGTVQAAVDAINNDAINSNPDKGWIVASKLADGNGTLANVTDQSFTGGNSGITGIDGENYTDFLAAAETQAFNLISLDGISDGAIQTSFKSWVVRVRSEGMGIMGVLGGPAADDIAADAVSKATTRSAGFNHEGIVNVGTGVNLDGTDYSSAQVAPYVAGLIGGQKLSESTTYAPTPFDDVTRRWTRAEQELAVTNGVFLLVHDGRIVKPLRGMNSLITLRQGQNNQFKKIRAIRVMDAMNSDMLKAAEDNYIGKVNNTEEGRLALLAAYKQYMLVHVQGGTIEATGWDVFLDLTYHGPNATITPEPDQVYVNWTARLTDVIEQIFGTFTVQ